MNHNLPNWATLAAYITVICVAVSGCSSNTASGPPPETTAKVSTNNVSDNSNVAVNASRSFAEEFSTPVELGEVSWHLDDYPNDGPFSDNGEYFTGKGVVPPEGYRTSLEFGDQGWLTAELYSRSSDKNISQLFSQVPDPIDPSNQVLRLASPEYTDGVVVRSTKPLPRAYQISVRVGFANFGDGIPGLNGYTEDSLKSAPWNNYNVNELNGFYWLSILDSAPRPHNNVWIHHHRKLTIDSCNHFPPWMEIYTGNGWKRSGEMPVMMFVLDGLGNNNERIGKPFISYSGDRWHHSGEIRAVDSYKPGQWYEVSITRRPPNFTLKVSGNFKYGGETSYEATINYEEKCVWHYNQPGEQALERAIDNSYFKSLGSSHPHWPMKQGWPDYFMIGEPHVNFYQGDVLYDDLHLEILE